MPIISYDCYYLIVRLVAYLCRYLATESQYYQVVKTVLLFIIQLFIMQCEKKMHTSVNIMMQKHLIMKSYSYRISAVGVT